MPEFKNISFFFKSFGLLSFIIVFWSACVKPPQYPVEPEIEFISLYQDTILQGVDSQFVTISFTDGDGDLGDTIENLFYTDLTGSSSIIRSQVIPTIPPQGIGNGISGEIKFLIHPSSSCCDSVKIPCQPDTDTDYPIETSSYSVFIVDRDGNESNEIKLPPFYMICNQ